jgi:hypothetical protein
MHCSDSSPIATGIEGSRGRRKHDSPVASSSQIVSLCRGYAKNLTVELGIVLQGECEVELPERLVGCIGINRLDLNEFCTDDHLL